MKLTVYTDGGSLNNPGQAASAYLIYIGGQLLEKKSVRLGIRSNNFAEYTALILALGRVIELIKSQIIHKPEQLECFSDSLLMVNQLRGIYKVKNSDLKGLFVEVYSLLKKCPFPVKFIHILREKNQAADNLVKEALSSPPPEF